MSSRLTRPLPAVPALVVLAMALGLSAPGTASASVSRPAAYRATPECLILPNCVSLYQFSPANSRPLVFTVSGAFSGAPVILTAADPANSYQDWTYIDLGTVGSYRHRGHRDTFGLTKFDFARYGSAEMYQLELSPGGFPSGFCAANVANKMVLRTCNGSRFQTMISTNDVGGARKAPLSYCYGLSVAQAPVAAHHLPITGSSVRGAQVTFSRAVISSNQFWAPG